MSFVLRTMVARYSRVLNAAMISKDWYSFLRVLHRAAQCHAFGRDIGLFVLVLLPLVALGCGKSSTKSLPIAPAPAFSNADNLLQELDNEMASNDATRRRAALVTCMQLWDSMLPRVVERL